MKLTSLIRNALAASALALIAAGASAQAWPAKPIKLVVGIPPGLQADVFARLYADKLSKALGQAVVVENKPGAAGNIAMDAVAKSPADGYTLLYSVSNSFMTNPYVYSKLPFDPDKDFVPVASILEGGAYIVVNKDLPVKNVQELVSLVRSSPDKYSYASYGIGGFPHLIMEMLSDKEKLQMKHAPYRANALTDVVAGNVHMVAESPVAALPFIKDGRLKAIAYLGHTRNPQTPDVPVLNEIVKGTDIRTFHGVWAPAGTPRPVITRLNQEIAKLARDPDVQERMKFFHSDALSLTPEEMNALIKQEQNRWAPFIKAKNIRAE